MADSPGKVLSSFTSSNDSKASSNKLGGCAGMFFQLLDRFNGKKLSPHKLLPSDRPKDNIISHTEEKLPMAKLLLIADENRIGSSMRGGDSCFDAAFEENKDCGERTGKRSVGVVARLMGLETMPSPEPCRQKKQIEVFEDNKEVQSSRKLLKSRSLLVEEGGKAGKIIDSTIQTLKKRTKSPHIDQIRRFEAKTSALNSVVGALKQSTSKRSISCNISQTSKRDTKIKSMELEDPKALFFSKLPAMPSFHVESPMRSILSPSRTSSKLLSPIKSPLSLKSTACLFGAASRVLEPNSRPTRKLGFHLHNTERLLQGSVGDNMNNQKMIKVDASSAPPSARTAAESIDSADNHQLNLEQGAALLSLPSMLTECKGQATGRQLNPSGEIRAPLSLHEVNALKPFISKEEQAKNPLPVKHDRKSNSKPAKEKKLATTTSQRQEVRSFTNGGGRLIPWRKSNKAPIKGSGLDSKQDNAALPAHDKEEHANQDEASKRVSRSIISRRQGSSSLGPKSAKGSSISTFSQPSRSDKSLQNFKKTLQESSGVINQEGNGKCVKTSYANAGNAAMRSSKTIIKGTQSKSTHSAQVKAGSPSLRSSAKRKASSYLAKPCAQEDVLPAVGDCFHDSQKDDITKSFGVSPSTCKEQSDSHRDTPRLCSFDGSNMTSSSDIESVVRTRARARWDISDERKREITKNCISCQKSDSPLADYHPGQNSARPEDASQIAETTAVSLSELLSSLNASTSQLCEGESGALLNERKRSHRDLMDLSGDSSSAFNSFLQEAEQSPQRCNTCPKEDASIRDSESVLDSMCAEEFEQPSPISILESPFQDSASSSSDSFETSHGRTQWEANPNEVFDCLNMMGRQIEDLKIHDVTSCIICIDPGAMHVEVVNDTVTENEDGYERTFQAAALSAIWRRFALSGALLDPAVLTQVEKQKQHFIWRATMPLNPCMENDYKFSPCRKRMYESFTGRRIESALMKRELLFDCIEEAVRLSLELAQQAHGFLVPCTWLPAAYFLKGVYKQIDEWKGLALSMNLDDMMKMEIDTGMGRWFKFGDEVENLAENIEAMIVRSLLDELMEAVIKIPA